MRSFGTEAWFGLLPALILLLVAVIIGADAALRRPAGARGARVLAVLGATAALVAVFAKAYRTRTNGIGDFVTTPGSSSMAPGSLTIDRLTLYGGGVLCVMVLIAALASETVTRRHPRSSGMFHATLLVAGAAGYLLLAQHDMTTLLPALVTLVVSGGLLAATSRTNRASVEASLNILVILGVALALLTYGLALLYGVTGSTDTYVLIANFHRGPVLSILSVALIVLGMAGLSGVPPLHRWLVDTAEGTPGGTAMAIATLIVLPTGMALLRTVEVWGASVWWWRGFTGALLAGGALYAALMAGRQTSVRRLLGYTLIGQAAVGLAGIITVGPGINGYNSGGGAATLFALFILGLTIAGSFAAVAAVEEAGIPDSVHRYRGIAETLGARGVMAGFAFAGVLGLPPAALFVAHLLEWQAALSSGYAWLVVLLVAASLMLALPAAGLLGGIFAPGKENVAPASEGWVSISGRLTVAALCVAPVVATLFLQVLMALASNAAGGVRGG